MTDWAALYRDHVTAVTALVSGLSDDDLAREVPGAPAWTVHDVLAHLAGGAADAVTGRTDGAPGPEWTARHVAERAVLPVAVLVEELETKAEAIGHSTVDNPRPAIVWDIAVHHADLHEALGLGRLPERYWRPVLETVVLMRKPVVPEGVDDYELFRGLFSRRSRAQLRSWGLDDDAVEGLGIFGPRDDDQPVPA
ncbi:maleylpyruvate isomerase family mycothiol-dependent enzyme [Nocardioides sp. C4-1]|uniref:maleylpyruvate isomerase family mycothiol-dependent enzyme n=1 Tax=Nocardioides sp. C4-1 TaxID=3151851 RepID=UPI003263C617